MEEYIDVAVASHAMAFPYAGCDKACIKAQLETFYDQCKGADIQAVDAQGKLIYDKVESAQEQGY
mgnify:CR=1 FL=1